MSEDRLIDPQAVEEELTQDRALRPRLLVDYVGQDEVCEQMDIFIQAAVKRKEALDHVLIFGPPGLGKTTLSHIIAHEMQVGLRQTSGPVIEKAGDLAAILTNLEPHDVLFIDEIHRLPQSPAVNPPPGVRGELLPSHSNKGLLRPDLERCNDALYTAARSRGKLLRREAARDDLASGGEGRPVPDEAPDDPADDHDTEDLRKVEAKRERQ